MWHLKCSAMCMASIEHYETFRMVFLSWRSKSACLLPQFVFLLLRDLQGNAVNEVRQMDTSLLTVF